MLSSLLTVLSIFMYLLNEYMWLFNVYYIALVGTMSVSGYSARWLNSRQHQYVVSFSKTLIYIASVDSAEKLVPDGNTIMTGVSSVLSAFWKKKHLIINAFFY